MQEPLRDGSAQGTGQVYRRETQVTLPQSGTELTPTRRHQKQPPAPTSQTPLLSSHPQSSDSEEKEPPKQTWAQWWAETKAAAKTWYDEQANWPNFKDQFWSDFYWVGRKIRSGAVWTWENKWWTLTASVLALHSTFNTIAREAGVHPEKLKEAWDNTLNLGTKIYAGFAGFASQYINTLMNIVFIPPALKRFLDIPNYWRNASTMGRAITATSLVLALGAAVASFSVSTAAFAWTVLPLALAIGGTALLSSFGTRSVTATDIGEKLANKLASSEEQAQEIDWLSNLKDEYREGLEKRFVAALLVIENEMTGEHKAESKEAREDKDQQKKPSIQFEKLTKEQKEKVFQAAIDYMVELSSKKPEEVFKNYKDIKKKYSPSQSSALFKMAMGLYFLCALGAGVSYFFTFLQKGFDGLNDFESKVINPHDPTINGTNSNYFENSGYPIAFGLGVDSGIANLFFAMNSALDVVWTLLASARIIRHHQHPVPVLAGFGALMYLNILAGGAMYSVAHGIVARPNNIAHIPADGTPLGDAFQRSVESAADAANINGSTKLQVLANPPPFEIIFARDIPADKDIKKGKIYIYEEDQALKYKFIDYAEVKLVHGSIGANEQNNNQIQEIRTRIEALKNSPEPSTPGFLTNFFAPITRRIWGESEEEKQNAQLRKDITRLQSLNDVSEPTKAWLFTTLTSQQPHIALLSLKNPTPTTVTKVLEYFKTPISHPLPKAQSEVLATSLTNMGAMVKPKSSWSSLKSWCCAWCPTRENRPNRTTYSRLEGDTDSVRLDVGAHARVPTA